MAKGRIEQEIVIKIIGGKDVGELAEAIKELEKTEGRDSTVDADTDDARKELDEIDKQLAELKGEKAEIEVTAKVDRALAALDEVAAEAKKAEAAAEALSVAFGPELAAKADVDAIIADFQRMGLSLDEITANADRLGGKLREVGQQRRRRQPGRPGSVGPEAASTISAGRPTRRSRCWPTWSATPPRISARSAGSPASAGVAIGQMGEYMADAAFCGEGLRSVLRNFGKVAGPIAAIGSRRSALFTNGQGKSSTRRNGPRRPSTR